MGVANAFIRAAALAGGRVARVRVLLGDTRDVLRQLREARELIDGVKILSPRMDLNRENIINALVQAQETLEHGTKGLGEIGEAFQKLGWESNGDFANLAVEVANSFRRNALDEAVKIPGLTEGGMAIVRKEREAFEQSFKIIEAYKEAPEVARSITAIAKAIEKGEIAKIPSLAQESLARFDELIKAIDRAMVAVERTIAIVQKEAAEIAQIALGGAGAAAVTLTPEKVQAAQDLVDDLEFRLKVDCQLEIEARRREPSLGKKVWENLKEGPDTGMMGLSPDVLDWSGAGAMTEVGITGYRYANTPNQPKCDDPIPQAVTQAEISRMRANVEAAWKTLEQQQIAKEQSPPANQPAVAESTPKFSLGVARG